MKFHRLAHEQFLPIPRAEAWAFFSQAKNLLAITPPSYGLEILSGGEQPVTVGALIVLRIRLAPGIHRKWITEISEVEAGHHFTDLQERGPFAYWEHHHEYLDAPGGTRVIDRIRYAMPFGLLGRLAHPIVRARLEAMFAERARRLAQRFGA